jgi:hypothetical protein
MVTSHLTRDGIDEHAEPSIPALPLTGTFAVPVIVP